MEWVLVGFLYLFLFIAMTLHDESKEAKKKIRRREYQREYYRRKKEEL